MITLGSAGKPCPLFMDLVREQVREPARLSLTLHALTVVERITIYTEVGVWATINLQKRQRRHAKNLCAFKEHSYCSHSVNSCPKMNLSTVRNLNITGVSKA